MPDPVLDVSTASPDAGARRRGTTRPTGSRPAPARPAGFDRRAGPASGVVERALGACRRCGVEVPDPPRPRITQPEDAAALLVPRLAGRDRETGVLLVLDQGHQVLAAVTASVGTVDHTFLSPRELLRDVLLANGVALVVGHNHPSGDPEPSPDDVTVSLRLDAAADVLGLRLLDHLVVGGTRWTSIARRGHLRSHESPPTPVNRPCR